MLSTVVRRGSHRFGDALLTGLAYFLAAALALQLTRFDGGVAVVWFAGALLFAKLSATPRHRWPGLMAACLVAGSVAIALFGIGGRATLPLAVTGIVEAWGVAWLLKRVCPRLGRFQSVNEAGWFLVVAGFAVPIICAVPGALCAHLVVGVPFWRSWCDWYAAHALGLVAFSPPVLLALRGELGQRARRAGRVRRHETVSLLGAVALTTGATFGQNVVPLVVLPIVPMVAATFRLGRFGAVLSVIILMSIGLVCSLVGYGPTALLHASMALKLQVLQLYFATVVLILLPLAAGLAARSRLYDRLRDAEALHRLILERTSDVMMRVGREGTVRYISPACERVWGYRPEEMIGRSAFSLVLGEDLPAVLEARRRALETPGETVVIEYRVVARDGRISWVDSHMCATQDEIGRPTGTVSILRETTERRQLIEDLARQALTDPLTGLANRRAFDSALAARQEVGGVGGCLALFDIDHFKRVNDAYGHPMGDRVLVRFAGVLRGALRAGDVVARVGGEEFAVLLSNATMEQAERVCERIRLRLALWEEPTLSGEVVRVTVSAGIAPLAEGAAGDAVMAAADMALYRAKDGGRNRLAIAA